VIPRRSEAGGFTLLEVMFALGTLALALGFLLSGAAANMTATRRAQMTTAATELARGKMLDIEEMLLHDGFQELEKTIDGDFEEEGWESIRWEAEILKIELPNIGAMESLSGDGEAEGESDGAAGSPLSGLLGMGAGDGGAGAGLIQSQFETFSNILEASVRKVILKVAWKAGAEEEYIVVDCYFTDPTAISRVLQGLPAEAAASEDGQASDGSPTSGGDSTSSGGSDGKSSGGGKNSGGSSGGTRGGGGSRR